MTDTTQNDTVSAGRCPVELVETAAEAGYFAVPREVSLVELAEREGIDDRTASKELRRGIEQLAKER
jgi:predicted DNA binding protein